MTDETKAELTRRTAAARQKVDGWLKSKVPRKRRLLNVAIIGGTLAAAMTAGPALGGPGFTAWLTGTLGLENPAWRLLCGAAAIFSIAATIATQVLKSQNLEELITRAQGCRAKLEVIEVGLATGYLDTGQATTDYLRCVEDVSFIQAQ